MFHLKSKTLCLVILLCVISPLFAASFQQYKIAINVAGRQRMLSQKTAKAAFLIAKIGQDKNAEQELIRAQTLFSDSLNNLINGNTSENIPAAVTPKIKILYKKIKQTWQRQYLPDLKKIMREKKNTNKALIDKANQLSLTLLKECNHAVTLYVQQARLDGITASGNQVNIAGRQRMLSQKITKEIMLYTLNVNKNKNKSAAEKSIALFDTSLSQLRRGDKALGLPEVTKPNILKQFYTIEDAWRKYNRFVNRTLGSNFSSTRIAKRINKLSNVLLKESNHLVQLFEK